jgi:hypothetical protein
MFLCIGLRTGGALQRPPERAWEDAYQASSAKSSAERMFGSMTVNLMP